MVLAPIPAPPTTPPAAPPAATPPPGTSPPYGPYAPAQTGWPQPVYEQTTGYGQPGYGQQPPPPGPGYPGYGGYGGQQPGWGPPPPAPERRNKRGLVIGVLAGVAAVAVIAGVVIAAPWNSGGGKHPGPHPSPTPTGLTTEALGEQMLHKAADALDAAHVASYAGTFTGDDGDPVHFTLDATSDGWDRGKLTLGGQQVSLVTAGTNSEVKAGKTFWKDKDLTGTTLKHATGHWVDAGSDVPEADELTQPMAPSNLASLMRDSAQNGGLTVGKPQPDGNGGQVRRVTGSLGRFTITASAPYTLTRVQSPVDTDDEGDSRQPLTDGTDSTVTVLSSSAEHTFRTAYAKDLAALKSAVDPEVYFPESSKATFTPCTDTSCTARFKLKSVSLSDNAEPDGKVHAVISIDITLDGHQVKHCSYTRSMKPGATTTLTCVAHYSASRYSSHTVRGLADAWARAISDSELSKLKSDFKQGKGGTAA
jgi:hypothetical protein